MQFKSSFYGSKFPAKLFSAFHQNGESELVEIKSIIEETVRAPRTWGIKEAADLIGRSVSWLRKNDEGSFKNRVGQARWTLERINKIREEVGTLYKRPPNSSPFVLPVINFKGGVGKTTTAISLAQKGAIEGLRTLLVDLDPQGSSTYNLGNLIPEVDLGEDDVANAIFLKDKKSIKKIIRSTHFHNVHILPANLMLQDLELILPNDDLNQFKKMGPAANRLNQALELIYDDYDLILVDCPPSMGSITVNALVASNGLIMPVPPASFDRASFVMFTSSLSGFYEQVEKELKYIRILITQHGGGTSDVFHESRMRSLYSHILTRNFYKSAEIEKAATKMMSIYDLEKPINDKGTYLRALEIVDGVMGEVISELKVVWEHENE